MKKRPGYCYLAWVFLIFLLFANVAMAQSKNIAFLIDLKGAIGPASHSLVVEGIARAEKKHASLIVLRLDTPGGLVRSMRAMIKSILVSPIPVVTYVAPSGARAASAGTYILYASHFAAMAPGTHLGAATPVQMGIGGGGKKPGESKKDKAASKSKQSSAMERKALNDARAYIRSLAQLRHRNVKWAEQAVTRAATLSAKEALRKNVINFVANDIQDLLRQLNGKVTEIKNTQVKLATKDMRVIVFEPGWRYKFLSTITDPNLVYILLMLGIYGLFFEFFNPGFVLPGVIGGIALLVALYGLHLLPVNYVGLGLIFLGVAFIVAEAFLPSFGALGIGGVVSFAIGSVMLMKTDLPAFKIAVPVIVAVCAVTLVAFLGMIHLVLRARRRPVVSGSGTLVGLTGAISKDTQGQTWLKVSGELWRVADGEQFAAGQQVRIIEVVGLQLKVEKEKI